MNKPRFLPPFIFMIVMGLICGTCVEHLDDPPRSLWWWAGVIMGAQGAVWAITRLQGQLDLWAERVRRLLLARAVGGAVMIDCWCRELDENCDDPRCGLIRAQLRELGVR